jgi:hypothetical protein
VRGKDCCASPVRSIDHLACRLPYSAVDNMSLVLNLLLLLARLAFWPENDQQNTQQLSHPANNIAVYDGAIKIKQTKQRNNETFLWG